MLPGTRRAAAAVAGASHSTRSLRVNRRGPSSAIGPLRLPGVASTGRFPNGRLAEKTRTCSHLPVTSNDLT